MHKTLIGSWLKKQKHWEESLNLGSKIKFGYLSVSSYVCFTSLWHQGARVTKAISLCPTVTTLGDGWMDGCQGKDISHRWPKPLSSCYYLDIPLYRHNFRSQEADFVTMVMICNQWRGNQVDMIQDSSPLCSNGIILYKFYGQWAFSHGCCGKNSKHKVRAYFLQWPTLIFQEKQPSTTVPTVSSTFWYIFKTGISSRSSIFCR